MAVNYIFLRQDAEDLVDLLEGNSDFILHDKTAAEMAVELREMFGMKPQTAEDLKKTVLVRD